MVKQAAKPEPVDPIEAITSVEYGKLWDKTQDWFNEHIFSINMMHQLILLASAFVASFILYRIFRSPIKNEIDRSKLSARNKRVAKSITKLLLPAIILVVIFFMTRVAASDFVGIDVWLIRGIMKALMAWIAIRTIVQFIDNSAVRNSFSIIIWSVAALSIFGGLEEATNTLDGIGYDFGTFHLSLLSVMKGAFFLFALIYFASFVASVFERYISKSRNLSKSSQVLLSKIVRVLLTIVALLLAITSSGIDLSLFAVFGGAVGLGVGFGLQKGIANLFSGITLLLDRSIQPGDIIELDNGTFGRIEHMAARYTEIVTLEQKSILIPNEELITKPVINWSHGSSLIRISVKFGVHYESDPHEVIKISIAAAKKVGRVVSSPTEPNCFMTEFGDSAINFTLSFFIKDPENGLGNVRGEVLLALWDAFKENGISIPYPHREVFIHQSGK